MGLGFRGQKGFKQRYYLNILSDCSPACMSAPLRPSVHPSVRPPSAHPSIAHTIPPSTPSLSPSICSSVHPSIHPSVGPSNFPSLPFTHSLPRSLNLSLLLNPPSVCFYDTSTTKKDNVSQIMFCSNKHTNDVISTKYLKWNATFIVR